MSYCFRNYSQIAADVREWSRRLSSQILAVCGIPRSGTLIAGMLAQHRNIHQVFPEQLLLGQRPWEQSLRRRVAPRRDGFVLVVDDTCWTGRTMPLMRERLAGLEGVDLRYGALYSRPEAHAAIDFWYADLPTAAHSFEHNFGHDVVAKHVIFDLDGTLCEDWTLPGEEGEFAAQYQQHLISARPLFLPSTKILAVCTARLERYRPQTEAWLRQHGIAFEVVHMAPFESPAARRAYGFARFKADYYALRSVAKLFVENDPAQAAEIQRRTRKPVLDFPRRVLLGGVDPVPVSATEFPLTADGGWHLSPRPALNSGSVW